jgi:hypothetical protein
MCLVGLGSPVTLVSHLLRALVVHAHIRPCPRIDLSMRRMAVGRKLRLVSVNVEAMAALEFGKRTCALAPVIDQSFVMSARRSWTNHSGRLSLSRNPGAGHAHWGLH